VIKWDALYGNDAVCNKIWKSWHACSGCFIACKAASEIPDGEYKGLFWQGTHYLVAGVLGQRLDITDYRQAIKLCDMFNRAGVDWYISHEMIDWLTRLYEEGKITEKETGGLVLKRNFETYVELLEKMVNREGIGAAMADGWFELSKRIGRDATTDYVQGNGIAKGTSCIYDARPARLDPMLEPFLLKAFDRFYFVGLDHDRIMGFSQRKRHIIKHLHGLTR